MKKIKAILVAISLILTIVVFAPSALADRASCLADWQETSATVGQTIHADFTWSGAFYNPNQGFYATMSIWGPDNQQRTYYTEQYASSGSHTLSFQTDMAGNWKAYIFVYTGFTTYITDDDYLTVTSPPQLSYSPTTINFGTHDQGWTGSSTFQIWNSGGGTLTYSLSESLSWITGVMPTAGSSTGEHDTITVSVGNTGSMSGYYSGYISISSDGGNGNVFVDITINPPSQPSLSYSPSTINFGTHNQGWTGSSTFEIWNSGSGTLTYSLSESLNWITVSPTSGSSTGEHDTITVSVVNTGSMSGYYSGYISISSNGGSGSVFVDITISQGGQNPPYTPSNPYPGNNAESIPVVATLSWSGGDPDGDAVTYDLYISVCPQPDYFSPYNTEDITTDEYLIWLSVDQTYYWKVVATDEHGAQSAGPIWTFSTQTTNQVTPAENTPPNKPATPSISSLFFHVHDVCVYTTTVVDPNGDNVNLYWDFDEDDMVDFELLNVTSGDSHSILYIWDKPVGVYNVRVIATDLFGNNSGWSDSKTVYVQSALNNIGPSTPSAPAGDSIVYKDQPSTFTAISYDPNGDNIKYQWDFNGWLTTWDAVSWVPSGTMGSYTWIFDYEVDSPRPVKVRTKDINGVTSDWSAPAYVYIIAKKTSTIFNRNDFCGFTYGNVFDNFPGSGRLMYANGTTGAIATGAYGGFPAGNAWSTACQGVEFHVGRTKTLTVDAEISYIGGTPSLFYSCLKEVIKVDGPYKPDQQYIEEVDSNLGSVEDLQAFSTAAIGLLKNGVYQPSGGLKVWDLVDTTLWTERHLENYPYHAELADQLAEELRATTIMNPKAKQVYTEIWNKVQMDGGFVPKGVSLETSTNTITKLKPVGSQTVVFGDIMAGVQVSLELLTLYDLMTHWQVDTLLKEFENSGQTNTIHVTHSFTFDEGDHTVWAGLQTESSGFLFLFGFAYAAGMVRSITIDGISPPNTPYLRWPEQIHVGNIAFEACGVDQNGDPLQYFIDWGDGTTTTTAPSPSNEWVDVPHRYSTAKTYTITIKSTDCDWMESPVNTYYLYVPLEVTQQQSQQQSTPSLTATTATITTLSSQQINLLLQKLLMREQVANK